MTLKRALFRVITQRK